MSQTKAQLIDTLVASLLPASDSSVDIGSNAVRFANIYGDTLYGNGANLTGINTDLVSDTSPQLGGTLDANGQIISFGDSSSASDNRLKFGASNDLSLYHQSNSSYILNTTGNLNIASNNEIRLKGGDDAAEHMGRFIDNGAVELYYDNAKKLHTRSDGCQVTGILRTGDDGTTSALMVGASDDLQIYHSGNHSRILEAGTGKLQLGSDTEVEILNGSFNESMTKFQPNGAVELYYDNSKKFETTSTGAKLSSSAATLRLHSTTDQQSATLEMTSSSGESQVGKIAYNHANSGIVSGYNEAFLIDGTETNLAVKVDGAIKIPDSGTKDAKLLIGAGDDLQIYHDGSHSRIVDVGTGHLIIQTSELDLMNAGGSEDMIKATNNGAVELYYDNSKKLETSSLGVTVTGGVYPAATDTYQLGGSSLRWNELNIKSVIDVSDNGKIRMGDSDDLQIYHDGSNSYLQHTGTGDLFIDAANGATADIRIKAQSHIYAQVNGNEAAFQAFANGGVELYYDNTKRFETLSDGVKISGNKLNITNTGSVDLYLSADTDNSNESHIPRLHFVQDGSATRFIIGTEGTSGTAFSNSAGNSPYFQTLGSLPLVVATNSVGRWQFTSSGHFYPMANGSYDIGSSSNRVRDIYTNDLNLSNEGGSNDVDGTWGSYTIQEGAEDLFLVNKRNGKKYKFNLTEVS